MRQENKDKKQSSSQRKSSEQAKIAHGIGADKQQTKESPNRGNTANNHRRSNLFKGFFGIGFMLPVNEVMHGIIDGNTENDRAGTNSDGRNRTLDEIKSRHRQNASKQYRNGNKRYGLHF